MLGRRKLFVYLPLGAPVQLALSCDFSRYQSGETDRTTLKKFTFLFIKNLKICRPKKVRNTEEDSNVDIRKLQYLSRIYDVARSALIGMRTMPSWPHKNSIILARLGPTSSSY